MHFEGITPGDYQEVIKRTLRQEFEEEAGLKINSFVGLLPLYPAFLMRDSIRKEEGKEDEPRTGIDLAFVTPIFWDAVEETPEFQNKLALGELRFCTPQELGQIDIVSPRMRFLILRGLEAACIIAQER